MNKYTELSDFEINLLVAQSVLPETQYDVIKQTMDIIQFLVDGSFGYRFFDPCNNPSDAMTIIIENKISVIFDTGCKEWAAGIAYWVDGYEWQVSDEVRKNNPLRAAMELFLIIKDAENEG
ncbi:phage protein NinX family protein [Proteus faecis]|uniref:phage protein NinX family protein n=1 Tax=Proteus faecis TaxID=2050967 RepID=UPI000D69B5BA|nr:phage protein NinX family protein [Proteus faecis]